MVSWVSPGIQDPRCLSVKAIPASLLIPPWQGSPVPLALPSGQYVCYCRLRLRIRERPCSSQQPTLSNHHSALCLAFACTVHTPIACLGQWRPSCPVEHQLVSDHLYCLHGGGTPPPKIFLRLLLQTGESPHLLAA